MEKNLRRINSNIIEAVANPKLPIGTRHGIADEVILNSAVNGDEETLFSLQERLREAGRNTDRKDRRERQFLAATLTSLRNVSRGQGF